MFYSAGPKGFIGLYFYFYVKDKKSKITLLVLVTKKIASLAKNGAKTIPMVIDPQPE
jgi:hypothetical protein